MKNTVPQGAWRSGGQPKGLELLVNQLRAAANYVGEHKTYTVTQDATPTLIWSEQMPSEMIWAIEADVLGYSVDNNVAFYRRHQRYRTNGAGTVTLVRSTTPIADDEDLAAWDITFTPTAAGVIELYVTGDAREVAWRAHVKVLEL